LLLTLKTLTSITYSSHRNCTWTIIAPLGNKLNISFSHFAVEEPTGEECVYDYVEVLMMKK